MRVDINSQHQKLLIYQCVHLSGKPKTEIMGLSNIMSRFCGGGDSLSGTTEQAIEHKSS